MRPVTKIYILFFFLMGNANASTQNRVKAQLIEAGKIAKNIQHIHPTISYRKALQYGRAIYQASRTYSIDSNLLISIAHQESSFRENLPEGQAGELGICQIRKMWVKNPKFQREFGNVKEKELLIPSKNFLFAAWILKDLRDTKERDVIPFWSYYNARKFHNRFKYFARVNRYLSAIQTKEPIKPVTEVAALWSPSGISGESLSNPFDHKKSRTIGDSGSDAVFERDTRYWRPVAQDTSTPSEAVNKGWIPAALRKLQPGKPVRSQATDPMIVKAAYELNMTGILGSLPVVD